MFEIMRFRIECCLLPFIENIFTTLLLQSVPAKSVGLEYGIPKIAKGIGIPIGLLEARDSLDAVLDAIDANVIWTESHDWTILLMRFMYRLILGTAVSFPENPQRRKVRSEVCFGNFREGGEEGRVEKESVDREE